MDNGIDIWKFLIGNWESDPESHIGDEKGTINRAKISHRPSDQYIFMINEAYKSENSQGEGWDLYFNDENVNKIKNKSVFAMGFVVNYIEESRTEDSFTLIAETVDSMPEGFGGSTWKKTIKKLSNDEFLLTLMMGHDNDFSTFWEAKYIRT